MISRRGFLGALIAAPIVARVVPAAAKPVIRDAGQTLLTPIRGAVAFSGPEMTFHGARIFEDECAERSCIYMLNRDIFTDAKLAELKSEGWDINEVDW